LKRSCASILSTRSTETIMITRYLAASLAILACAAFLQGLGSAQASDLQAPSGSGRVDMAGSRLYQSKCKGCHALDRNRYGPSHHELFGRTAGTQPGYRYSDALSRSRIVWTEASLDQWLQNPRRMVPGTRMDARFTDPEERRLIIEFLKSNPN
jgi:cytochrome c